MTHQAIQFECSEGIATITLDQPEQRNALSPQLIDDTRAALERIDADPQIRALILTARGAAFCAGGDLSMDLPEDVTRRIELGAGNLETRVNPLVRDLRKLHCPTISAVQGVAAGAGASLALAADITLAAHSASFFFPFMPRLGIIPDGGGTWLVPHKIGHARAMGACLLGDRIPAAQAEQWGLIWGCVEDASLQATARDIALRLARAPRHAAPELREAFREAEHNDFESQLRYEEHAQRRLLGTSEFYEGVQAFMGKREPRFS